MSQSPQTGQFNSYKFEKMVKYYKILKVSIPSNGSIQFLQPTEEVKEWSNRVIVSIPSNGSIQFLQR